MVQNISTFLYEEIARQITHQLDEGIISPGEKLPSLRSQSQQFGCSISVIMQAYAVLEAQGRIYTVEKSGTFASSPVKAPLPAPEKDSFTLQSSEARSVSIIGRIVEAANDRSIVSMGAGEPDPSYLPLTALRREIHKAMKDTPGILSSYTDELGLRDLRREISILMAARGVEADPETILLTNGCTEALSLAVESCSSPGDTLVLESPVFLGIIQLLKVLKRRIITVPTSPETGMDLDLLEEVLNREEVKAVVMTALYQNPLGFVMPEENRRRAVDLVHQYGINLIEDDIYHDCSFQRGQERSLKSWDREGRVIYCSSFSKTIAPGMRAGWMLGGRLQRRCRNLKMAQSLGNSKLYQQALAGFLHGGGHLKHLAVLQKTMARQAREMSVLLTRYLPQGTALSQPRGGYYLWVELPGKWNTLTLFEKLLKERISIVPGGAFSPEDRYLNCMRISYASPITEKMEEAVETLGRLIQENLASF